MDLQFLSDIMVLLYIIVNAFLVALFINNKARLLRSLAFATIGYAIMDVLCSFGLWEYLIFVGLLIAMLTSNKKFVPWLMRVSAGLLIVKSIMNLIEVRNYHISTGWFDSADWIGLIGIENFIINMIIMLCVISFALATDVLRDKREKNGSFNLSTDECYIAQRDKRSGCADAGNILSAMSFIFTLTVAYYAIRYYVYDYYLEPLVPISLIIIIGVVLIFVCALAAFILLSIARANGYSDGVFATVLYVWSWIPMAILILMMALLFTILGAASGEGAASKLKKKVYRIRDEKGELRTLKYDGNGMEAVDDKGDIWVTYDKGETFSKRDLFVYTDPEGKREYMRDPYGGSIGQQPLTHLVDKKGKEYVPSRFGVLEEKRFANYDDGSPKEIIETYRVRESETRKAEIFDEDDDKQ